MQATPGSTIAPILLDAPQNIEAALSVRVESVPDETLVAGPYTGTATEYAQEDGSSNYQAAPLLLPGSLPVGTYSVAFTHASLARPVRIPLEVVGSAPETVTFAAVMAAVETMMRPRLKVGNFSEGGGGVLVDHFQDDPATRPTLATATEAVARHTAEADTDYSGAEGEDAPAIVTVAALRTAIELESTHYPEQVAAERSPARFWLELLTRYEDRLAARESENEGDVGPDGGGPGLDAVWNFGPRCDPRAPGSEAPIPLAGTRCRRVW
jgi:hypothetical protein